MGLVFDRLSQSAAAFERAEQIHVLEGLARIGSNYCNSDIAARPMAELAKARASLVRPKSVDRIWDHSCASYPPGSGSGQYPLRSAIFRSQDQHFGITGKRLVN